jgi:hypothetical protein
MVACGGCGAQLHVSAVSCPHCKLDRAGQSRSSVAGRRYGHAAPPKSFTDAIGACFSKYATFSGRASRSEYWYFQLFFFIVLLMAAMVSDLAISVLSIGLLLPVWASGSRRLHDANMSGWRQLLVVIPFVGLLVLYWFCKGPVDPNDYND